jgi:hypothetical protein
MASGRNKVVKALAAHVRLSRESLPRAFDGLVLPDGVLDQEPGTGAGADSLCPYVAARNLLRSGHYVSNQWR